MPAFGKLLESLRTEHLGQRRITGASAPSSSVWTCPNTWNIVGERLGDTGAPFSPSFFGRGPCRWRRGLMFSEQDMVTWPHEASSCVKLQLRKPDPEELRKQSLRQICHVNPGKANPDKYGHRNQMLLQIDGALPDAIILQHLGPSI